MSALDFKMPSFTIHHGMNGWIIQVVGGSVQDVWVAKDVTELVRLTETLLKRYLAEHEELAVRQNPEMFHAS